jgi:DNA-binding transcriptional MerR regulator
MVSPALPALERLKSLEGQAMAVAKPPAAQGYRIGDAAARSGVTAANIRYYEKEALIAPQARGDNSYRLYTDADVHRLRFIRLCRAMDMSLDEVRTLLGLDLRRKADCDVACIALDAHLGHVREWLRELRSLEQDLAALRDCCDGSDARCHIIESLHARADRQPAAAAPRTRAARHV